MKAQKKKEKGQPRAVPEEKKKEKEPTPLDRLKLEVAEDLSLADKVQREGWGGLSSAENGRVGAALVRRLRELRLRIGPGGTLVPDEL